MEKGVLYVFGRVIRLFRSKNKGYTAFFLKNPLTNTKKTNIIDAMSNFLPQGIVRAYISKYREVFRI